MKNNLTQVLTDLIAKEVESQIEVPSKKNTLALFEGLMNAIKEDRISVHLQYAPPTSLPSLTFSIPQEVEYTFAQVRVIIHTYISIKNEQLIDVVRRIFPDAISAYSLYGRTEIILPRTFIESIIIGTKFENKTTKSIATKEVVKKNRFLYTKSELEYIYKLPNSEELTLIEYVPNIAPTHNNESSRYFVKELGPISTVDQVQLVTTQKDAGSNPA